jgi:pimeloyl-ACP methyl ester carboxylesterase
MQITRSFKNNDCKIAVYETDANREFYLLLLHGNSESADIFKEQFNSSLIETFQLVAIDLPGHGKSSHAEEPSKVYNMPYIVSLIGEIIKNFNKPVIIAGSSFGGHIALELLYKNSHIIKGVFIDGTPPLSSSADFGNAFLPNPASACLFKEENSEEELKQLSAACINDPEHFAFFERMIKSADPRFRSQIFKSLLNNEILDEKIIAETNQTPIAVLIGEADKIINLEYIKNLAFANLWRTQINLIPNAAHLPCLENPLMYNDLLTQFVNDVWQEKSK